MTVSRSPMRFGSPGRSVWSRSTGSCAVGMVEKSGQIRSLKKCVCMSSSTGAIDETARVWPFPELSSWQPRLSAR